jgi:hypothetical protein
VRRPRRSTPAPPPPSDVGRPCRRHTTLIFTYILEPWYKYFVRDFSRYAVLSIWQALIFTYILEPVYMMVRRCGRTYSWIYWRTKEIDIGDFFLTI